MGSENVRKAYALWGDLDDAPFRALVYMALVAMDGDAPPLFWQGREALAVALGRNTPDKPGDGDSRARRESIDAIRAADFQAVKRVISVLISKGVVAVHQRHAPGRPAVYSLHLDRMTGYGHRTDQGTATVPNKVRPPYPTGTATVPCDGGVGGVTFGTKELQQTSKPTTISPLVGTLLALSTGEWETRFQSASEYLTRLPDLGAQLLAAVDTLPGIDAIHGMSKRQVAAHLLATEYRELVGVAQ